MSNAVCTDGLAKTAVKLWRGDDESLAFQGASANRVDSFTRAGEMLYLRLTSNRERLKEQIAAELDFIFYLRRGGVSAVPAVVSVNGQLVEEVNSADELFFACAFEPAEGERFNYADFPASARREHFRLRGRTLGQIHALSKNYVPAENFRRPAWHEDRLLREIENFLPVSEKVVRQQFERLREKLRALPQTAETYGLIHGDFGETNYRYQDARLNIFDFDDCSYHWFAYDLAISIYPHGWRTEGPRLLDWLLEGYAENAPVSFTRADITLFCHWRLIYMFLVYARKWGFKDLSPAQAAWFARKRENIARGYEWAS
jgi:amicoumacin kinase